MILIYNIRDMSHDGKLFSSLFNWVFFQIKLKQVSIATINETLDRLLDLEYSMCDLGMVRLSRIRGECILEI